MSVKPILPDSFINNSSPMVCFSKLGLNLNQAFTDAMRGATTPDEPCYIQMLVRAKDAQVVAISSKKGMKWAVRCTDQQGKPVSVGAEMFSGWVFEKMGWEKSKIYVVRCVTQETPEPRMMMQMLMDEAEEMSGIPAEEKADLSNFEIIPRSLFLDRKARRVGHPKRA